MATINVQFSDAASTAIISYFNSPQDPAVYPNIGTIDTSDARWLAFYNAQPADFQKYFPAPSA